MNEDIKQRWIDALRSGAYQQTTQYLREGDRYCCLGVLCDLFDPDLWTRQDDDYVAFITDDAYLYLGSRETLPQAVVAWACLPDENPTVAIKEEVDDFYNDLGSLNDSGLNFNEIADLIEEQL